MPIPSNLYAEKIFSEHPVALWALDDDISYISLISEEQREHSNWQSENCVVSDGTGVSGIPFSGSSTILLSGEEPFGDSEIAYIVSENLYNLSDIRSRVSTISIGSYFYAESPYITSVGVGYEYYDTVTGNNVRVVTDFDVSIYGQWSFISDTFVIPDQNTTFRLVLRVTYLKAPDTQEYNVRFNGITIGQWSEEFQSTSLGSQVTPPPESIDVDGVILADLYGIESNPAFHIVENNNLLAKNTGIPMVYGATNVTSLSKSSDGKPSIIFPGYGFLHDSGKYKTITFESWIRIDANSSQNVRVFGPINSSDGIYVNGPFIAIKIGTAYESYFVGEWQRPMLLDFRYSESKASLLINGEEAISLSLTQDDINFSADQEDDFLGFYCNDDVESIDLDCVAVYSYIVPNIVAKRRWVYGQGVDFPENINTAYSGTSLYVDYQFADYSNNYAYPSIGKWNQGIADNLFLEENTISSPRYPLPEISFSNKTKSEWQIASQLIQNEDSGIIKLKPNSEWSDTDGFMYFNSLSFILNGLRSIFVKTKRPSSLVESEPLITLYDKISGNYIQISMSPDGIDYIVKYNGQTSIFYTTTVPFIGEEFFVGIDAKKMSSYFGGNVASVLGKLQSLSLYIGGMPNFSKTFSGNIYEVGLVNERSFSSISDAFAINGVYADHESFSYFDANLSNQDIDSGEYSRQFWAFIYDGGSPAVYCQDLVDGSKVTYLLHMSQTFNKWSLDISASSYWEDYIPLAYFATYVSDKRGDQYYDVDFIQFNIDFPAPSRFVESETSSPSGWTYSELYNQYQNPVQRDYSSLDNQLFTGYSDYEDLMQKTQKQYNFDTENSMVKTYITFQNISSGVSLPASAFSQTVPAPKSGVIIPGDDWITTKYEVVNNSIVYPPQGVSISDMAIVTHIEISNPSITNNPIRIKRLQYASQALSQSSYNPVGTRFGVPIYPYKRSGIYFDFKSLNPFSIYKDSSPYLYLTRYSGIQPRGDYDPTVSRGLMTPINQTMASNYRIIASQLALRYDEDFFPYAPTQIFELQAKDTYIKIFMVANDPTGKRAKLYAIDAYTGQLEDGIAFYLNGKLVKDPVIGIKQWNMLGISFANTIDVSNDVGFFRVTGPVMINSLSYYQSTNLQEVQKVSVRPWFRVRQVSAGDILDWNFWNSFYMWKGVLVVSSTSYYGVDPSDIYKVYTGTNKIIFDDNNGISVRNYEYSVLKDIRWSSQISSAV